MTLLTVEEAIKLTRLSRCTLYRRIKEGKFPRPLRVGPRGVRFRSDDVEAWIESLPTNEVAGT